MALSSAAANPSTHANTDTGIDIRITVTVNPGHAHMRAAAVGDQYDMAVARLPW